MSPDPAVRPLPVDAERMRASRFFLTANSRAPEMNPSGQPKVGIWPLWVQEERRTAYDHLAAFCCTAGENLYAFQRMDANSQTRDWDDILRNREMYEYLLRQIGNTIPGAGGNFSTKWGEDELEQVLTLITDYVRCTNLRERARPVSSSGTGGSRIVYTGNGQVAPLRPTGKDTMGFGRYFTITEFGLHFICNAHGDKGLEPEDIANRPPNSTFSSGVPDPLEPSERWVQAALLLEPTSVALGFPALVNNFTVRISGLEEFQLEDQPMGFPAEARRRPGNLTGGWHGIPWGGPMGIRTFIGGSGDGYTYKSKRIRIRGNRMKFSGGAAVVEIFHGDSVEPENLVQTINLNFPEGDFPAPDIVTEGTSGYRGAGATDASYWWGFGEQNTAVPDNPKYTRFGGRYRHTWRAPYAPNEDKADPTRRWPNDRHGNPSGFKQGGVFRAEDVVRSLVPYHGDNRLLSAQREVPNDLFQPVSNDYSGSDTKFLHLFHATMGAHRIYGFGNEPGLSSPAAPGTQLTDADYHYARLPDVRPGAGQYNRFGDFDNGVAQLHDGAYINRPDEGNSSTAHGNWGGGSTFTNVTYFAWNVRETREVNFSPNRMVPSPVIFGSLPTGIKREIPWQTLLFRPHVGLPSHPGESTPADHYLLEYFWMPVIEPYAISEPFSTAGKVNMNYQLLPFGYVERSTGLRAVLKSEEPLAIDNEFSEEFKLWDHETSDWPFLPNHPNGNTDREVADDWTRLAYGEIPQRKPVDADQTLRQFEQRFENGKLFQHASEICEVHLVREGENLTEYETNTFWPEHLVTGDNSRERPYANLYPRLTTRSNTFRVHFWTESLKKARDSEPDEFDPELDSVVGRYRGSTLVERYIDPNETDFPDFAQPANDDRHLEEFVRIRILESNRFAP